MANEEKKNVTVNEEAKTEETKAPEQPKQEEVKKTTTTIEVNPKVAKAIGITKKVLKYAVPVGIAAGSVFLGIKIGGAKERKSSGIEIDRLNGQIGDLQKQLEMKPDVVPALPDTSSALDVVPMDIVE